MIDTMPKPPPYRYGPNRRAIHSLAGPKRLRTVAALRNSGFFNDPGWYLVAWEDVLRGDTIRVYEPSGQLMPGVFVVDGFIPDGGGVFGTKVREHETEVV